jgi:hypothetical protein
MTRAIDKELVVGACLRGRSLKLTLARVLAFSGGNLDEPEWPQRNLHTDASKAREAGLPGIIASGTQFEGLLLSHLIDWVGDAWYAGGTLDAKIIKSVYINDSITPVARVTAIDDEAIEFDVWCENQQGEKALIGYARVPRI